MIVAALALVLSQLPPLHQILRRSKLAIELYSRVAHMVNFLNYFSRSEEKTYRATEATLKRDIANKAKLPENKERLVEADSVNVKPY